MVRRFLAARAAGRALSRNALKLLFALAFGFMSLAPNPAMPSISAISPALPEQMLEGVNRVRAEAGLALLVRAEALDALAAERSTDMAARGYFSHTTPEGLDVFALMDRRGIGFSTAAENLAWNTYAEERAAVVALQGFLDSPPHRANLFNPAFSRVGVGVARDGGKTYFTLVFVG
jgi:uncharacterized protein YkwD